MIVSMEIVSMKIVSMKQPMKNRLGGIAVLSSQTVTSLALRAAQCRQQANLIFACRQQQNRGSNIPTTSVAQLTNQHQESPAGSRSVVVV